MLYAIFKIKNLEITTGQQMQSSDCEQWTAVAAELACSFPVKKGCKQKHKQVYISQIYKYPRLKTEWLLWTANQTAVKAVVCLQLD